MRKQLVGRILVGALAVYVSVVAFGCGGGGSTSSGPGGGNPGVISFSQDVQPIFNTYCVICHTIGGESEFMLLTPGNAYNSLVNVVSTMTIGGGLRVAPSDSTNSVLWKRISGIGLDPSEEQMPKDGNLPQAERLVIQAWIDQGAANN
jgi:hypothetical protein